MAQQTITRVVLGAIKPYNRCGINATTIVGVRCVRSPSAIRGKRPTPLQEKPQPKPQTWNIGVHSLGRIRCRWACFREANWGFRTLKNLNSISNSMYSLCPHMNNIQWMSQHFCFGAAAALLCSAEAVSRFTYPSGLYSPTASSGTLARFFVGVSPYVQHDTLVYCLRPHQTEIFLRSSLPVIKPPCSYTVLTPSPTPPPLDAPSYSLIEEMTTLASELFSCALPLVVSTAKSTSFYSLIWVGRVDSFVRHPEVSLTRPHCPDSHCSTLKLGPCSPMCRAAIYRKHRGKYIRYWWCYGRMGTWCSWPLIGSSGAIIMTAVGVGTKGD